MTGLPAPGSAISRLAAVGLVVLVAALGLFGVVLPLHRDFTALDARIARSEEALRRYVRSLPAAGEPASGEALVDGRGPEGLLLSGASEAVAAAQVQRFLKKVVAAHGGSLETIQVEPAEPLDGPDGQGLLRIGLKVRARLTVARLQNVLHDVETARPYLFVDGLAVRQARGFERETGRGQRDLDVQIDLFGLWRAVGSVES
ncbi:MAG: type II secretion system protein GspM [Alphaproteobacteria bacterium]